MANLKLTKGLETVVDDEDYAELAKHCWSITTGNKKFHYAHRKITVNGMPVYLRMHRVIMGLASGDKRIVDHIDGNTLNNCKSNLRITDRAGNRHNSGKQSNGVTSAYIGVHKRSDAHGGKYAAQININGKRTWLGSFNTAEEAASAYDKAAKESYGEFAKLNKTEAARIEAQEGTSKKRYGKTEVPRLEYKSEQASKTGRRDTNQD